MKFLLNLWAVWAYTWFVFFGLICDVICVNFWLRAKIGGSGGKILLPGGGGQHGSVPDLAPAPPEPSRIHNSKTGTRSCLHDQNNSKFKMNNDLFTNAIT